MSLADTRSTPIFVDSAPDWGRPVVLVASWATVSMTNREGGDQRSRTRAAPRFSLAYERRGLRPYELASERGRELSSLGAAVVVPIWTEYQIISVNGITSVTLPAAPSSKMKVGSWAYFVEGSNTCFRKVTAITGAVLTLADSFPVGFGFSVFTAAARCYPCILGRRSGYALKIRRADRADGSVEVEEL